MKLLIVLTVIQPGIFFKKKRRTFGLLVLILLIKDVNPLPKKIRQKNDVVPIIFLTAKSMEEDKINGFQAGADDFIVKPFSMKELLLRMQVFLRRNKMLMPETKKEICLGRLKFYPDDMRIVD